MSDGKAHSRLTRAAGWGLWFLLLFALLCAMAPGLEFYYGSADHAYHLSFARQMLLGRHPFIDVFTCYGPLNAVIATVMLRASDSLVGESATCAAGYALALTLVAVIVSRLLSARRFPANLLPFVFSIAGLLFLGRFMKWFFWLFPLLTVAALSLTARTRPRLGVLLAGCAAGLMGLCRLDLGVSLCGATVLYMFVLAVDTRRWSTLAHSIAIFALGVLIPASVWLAYLLGAGGVKAIVDYFHASTSSSEGLVRVWNLPFPSGVFSNPLSAEYRPFECGVALTLLYALSATLAAWKAAIRHERDTRLQVVLAASLAGLSLLPQGLYRHDANHVLQTFAPALVVVPGLLFCLVDGIRAARRLGASLPAVAAVAVLMVFLPGFERALHKRVPYDYKRIGRSSVARFQSLYGGVPAGRTPATARIVARIMELTTPAESILVTSHMAGPQIAFFAQRPVSGLVTTYAEGIFDSPFWRERNMEAVRRQPPALVVVPLSFDEPSARSDLDKAPFSGFQPELYAYIRENYKVTIATEGAYAIMAREARPAVQ